MVGEEGLEPSSLAATDFKSAAYTNSATRPKNPDMIIPFGGTYG